LRGEGWGEGLPPKFGQEMLKYSIDVLNHLIVPNADNAVTELG
jgi:hypothetical protein